MAPARKYSSSALCFFCVCLLYSFVLVGCSQNQPGKITEPLVRHSSVHGGQQPVSGATMQLYAVGTLGDGSAATALLTHPVTSDANGNFDITGAYTCPSASSLVYITAKGGNPGLNPGTNNTAIALMAALGPCGSLGPSTFVSINELTTVAAVWSLAPFISSYSSIGSGTSDAPALAGAFTLASEYVNTATGAAPGLNLPAGTTVPVAQLNTLANILSTCVNSAGGVAGDGSVCGTLFAAATPNDGTAPVEVIGAGLNIANNPTGNVSVIMGLAPPTAPFQPTLAAAPADWAVQLAAPSGLSASSDAITFPAAYINFPSTYTLKLTNNGPLAVPIICQQIVGQAASDFFPSFCGNTSGLGLPYGTCSSSLGLPAGATCELPITFTPSATGQRSATLLIGTSSTDSSLSIPLTGLGLPLSGGPVTLSHSGLNFTLAGVPQQVTVTNSGTVPVSIAVPSNPYYNYVSQTNNCGGVLAAQSICDIFVQVNAVGTTGYSGTTRVITSATSGIQQIGVSVAAASANFSATPLSFGPWSLGVTSPVQVVSANSGCGYYCSSPYFYGTISGPNASDFALAPNAFTYCPPTYQCQLPILFTPSALGTRTATLVTNLGNIALSGTGIPVGPSFTIAAYDTPSEPVGVASASTSLSIVNNGSTTLTLSSPSVGGTNPGDFAVTGACGYGLGVTNSCNLNVVFTPTQAGPRSATLTITDTTSGTSKSIQLNGIGNPHLPIATPNALTFGNTEVGATSSTQMVTVSAPNGDPVTFIDYGSGDFLLSPGSCATQTPCQVGVVFKPTRTGSIGDTIHVVDSATTENSYLTLTGVGGVATVSLSSPSLTFAARNEGTTSIAQTITLTNTGDTVLNISGVAFTGANAGDFSLQGNTCGTSVISGGQCTISVSFDPQAPGARSAILQIVSNAASSPDSVQLSGTGN